MRDIELTSTLPGFDAGDPEEDEAGEPLPECRPLLAFLRGALEARGFEIDRTRDPDPGLRDDGNGIRRFKHYGWELIVRRPGGRWVTIVVQGSASRPLLICDEHRTLADRLLRRAHTAREATVTAIAEVLRADRRFRAISVK